MLLFMFILPEILCSFNNMCIYTLILHNTCAKCMHNTLYTYNILIIIYLYILIYAQYMCIYTLILHISVYAYILLYTYIYIYMCVYKWSCLYFCTIYLLYFLRHIAQRYSNASFQTELCTALGSAQGFLE
jgi:hypothetical protein